MNGSRLDHSDDGGYAQRQILEWHPWLKPDGLAVKMAVLRGEQMLPHTVLGIETMACEYCRAVYLEQIEALVRIAGWDKELLMKCTDQSYIRKGVRRLAAGWEYIPGSAEAA